MAHGISVALYNTGFGLASHGDPVFYRTSRPRHSFVIDMDQQAVKFVDIVHRPQMNFRKGKGVKPRNQPDPVHRRAAGDLIFLMVSTPTASLRSCRSPCDGRRRAGEGEAAADRRHHRRQGQLHGHREPVSFRDVAGWPTPCRTRRKSQRRKAPAQTPVVVVNADHLPCTRWSSLDGSGAPAGYEKLTFAAQAGGK